MDTSLIKEHCLPTATAVAVFEVGCSSVFVLVVYVCVMHLWANTPANISVLTLTAATAIACFVSVAFLVGKRGD